MKKLLLRMMNQRTTSTMILLILKIIKKDQKILYRKLVKIATKVRIKVKQNPCYKLGIMLIGFSFQAF